MEILKQPYKLVQRNVISILETEQTQMTKLYHTLVNEGDGLVRNEWMKRQLLSGRKW